MIGNVPQRAQEPLCDAGEFVVECHSYKGKTYPHSGPQRVHECVVRCRDCRYYEPNTYSHFTCELLAFHVQSDGFCSMGELREG